MTPDDLRARLLANLRVHYAEQTAERPDGLTASRLLGCRSYAARKLLGQPEASSHDVWRAERGTAIHEYLSDLLAEIDPGFVDGRTERFSWDPGHGLPVITGAFDFALDGTLVELKTASRASCRWAADHGADPQHCAQVAVAAQALGYREACVLYVPTDAGADEIVVVPVEVDFWADQARSWLGQLPHQVDVTDAAAVQHELDTMPDAWRDKPLSWCRNLCAYMKTCRGDFEADEDKEITDPVMRTAAKEADRLGEMLRELKAEHAAAKEKLAHAAGVVHGEDKVLRVQQQVVAPSGSRRGSVRTVVREEM